MRMDLNFRDVLKMNSQTVLIGIKSFRSISGTNRFVRSNGIQSIFFLNRILNPIFSLEVFTFLSPR